MKQKDLDQAQSTARYFLFSYQDNSAFISRDTF